MLKIKVEHDDVGVAATVAGIIDKALTDHGFSNIKGKMVMALQEVRQDEKGAPQNFGKVNELTPLVDPQYQLRPMSWSTELMEARIAYGYPVMVDWMREARPEVFGKPVFIDSGIEPTPFQRELKAFAEGTSA